MYERIIYHLPLCPDRDFLEPPCLEQWFDSLCSLAVIFQNALRVQISLFTTMKLKAPRFVLAACLVFSLPNIAVNFDVLTFRIRVCRTLKFRIKHTYKTLNWTKESDTHSIHQHENSSDIVNSLC